MLGDFEVDPAAEFLERERKELEGIEDDPTLDFLKQDAVPNSSANGNGFQDNGEADQGSNSMINDFEFVECKNNGYAILEPQAFAEPVPVDDCEKVKLWKQEFIKRIEDKDSQELLSNQAMRDEAAAALAEWMRRTDDQRSNTRANNRQDEDAFVEERDSTTPGGEWERVCRLCDFSTTKSVTSSGINLSGRKDVSRMRGLLLQLKQTPPVHFTDSYNARS